MSGESLQEKYGHLVVIAKDDEGRVILMEENPQEPKGVLVYNGELLEVANVAALGLHGGMHADDLPTTEEVLETVE